MEGKGASVRVEGEKGAISGWKVFFQVYTDGRDGYNVDSGLLFSFPVTCKDGQFQIVKNLPIDEFSRKKLEETTQELLGERKIAMQMVS